MATYAILVDVGPSGATATEVTTEPSMAADSLAAELDLGGWGYEFALVPDGTEDHDRLHLDDCEIIADTGPFMAQHWEG